MQKYDRDEVLTKYQTKEGLIPCKSLCMSEIAYYTRSRELHLCDHPEFVFYLVVDIRGVVDFLIKNAILWNQAAIRVINGISGRKGLPIFGVDFWRAINIVLRENFHKAKFQIAMPERFKDLGCLADLTIHLKQDKDSKLLELEAWQQVKLEDYMNKEVHYIHMIFPYDSKIVIHLDGAIILLSKEDSEKLFYYGNKIKGISYEKQFRLDGQIDMRNAIQIIRSFLLIEELTDEFFLISQQAK